MPYSPLQIELTVEELYFDLDLPAGDAVWLHAIENIPLKMEF